MKKIIVYLALLAFAPGAYAQTVVPTTSSVKCPQGYALDVGQPTPLPPDDPANPDQSSKTAAERQREDQAAMAAQFAHWQCVPLTNLQGQ